MRGMRLFAEICASLRQRHTLRPPVVWIVHPLD
jgi:hypothetical protein